MINYNVSNVDIELETNIDIDKASMFNLYNKNFETQEKTLEYIIAGLEHSDFNNFGDSKLVWNIAAYINIISYDLKIIGRDIAFARTDWQKRHYIRQACLIIHESIDDLFQLLGKEFNDLIKNRVDISTLNSELLDLRKDLNHYKSRYLKTLKEIRNVAIAHRDTEVLTQFNLIVQISWTESIGMMSEFDDILNRFGRFLSKLMQMNFTGLK